MQEGDLLISCVQEDDLLISCVQEGDLLVLNEYEGDYLLPVDLGDLFLWDNGVSWETPNYLSTQPPSTRPVKGEVVCKAIEAVHVLQFT